MRRVEFRQKVREAVASVERATVVVEFQHRLLAGWERLGDEAGIRYAKSMLAGYEESLGEAIKHRDQVKAEFAAKKVVGKAKADPASAASVLNERAAEQHLRPS
jgi:hypothetical protein